MKASALLLPIIAVIPVVVGLAVGCESVNRALQSAAGHGSQGELTADTVASGLKEALVVGAARASDALSQAGAYSSSPALRIKLPEKLTTLADTLSKIGFGKEIDALELKMNDAAEAAAVEAKAVIVQAVKDMTIADALGILRGGDTAATDYMRRTSWDALAARYEPIVTEHLETLGFVRLYNQLVGRYEALPLTPQLDLDVEGYVTERALDGLFAVVAQEERRIRENPLARTTDLLRRVFGSTP